VAYPFALFAQGADFDFFSHKIFAVIASELCTYKFTIDKRPDLEYTFACYLEQPSPTPHPTTALTLDRSYCCSLLVVAKKVNSFGIKQIQALFPNHPGWGIPAHLAPVGSATYSLPPEAGLFLRDRVII
jgi:hypothetical protein